LSQRIIKILGPKSKEKDFKALAEEHDAIQYWASGTGKSGHCEFNILVNANKVQAITDKLQRLLSKEKGWHILTQSLDSIIPRQEDPDENDAPNNARKLVSGTITREALYSTIKNGSKVSSDFIILVALSTIVAAIGIINDNIAIVIAAMVIAPLLGPNLALSFGVTLGDRDMITDALKANSVGFGLTLLLSALIGMAIPLDHYAQNIEYLTRIDVGYSAIILALASGIAAVLSLTSGVSSAMVGVMVAVAMMPPAVVLGLNFGAGQWEASYGSFLLLAVNIICVNLSAKLVFSFKGIRPRTWYQRKKSKQSLQLSFVLWVSLLVILCVLIFLWQNRVEL